MTILKKVFKHRQRDIKTPKSMIIAADNIEALEEMVKFWENKGYEVSSQRFSDRTNSLRLFYWQQIKKK